MNVIYRWMLNAGNGAYQAHPLYKDDLSLNYERETGQQFFRAKLSSKLTFVANDAYNIIHAGFATDFKVTIQKSTNMGVTWSDYYKCHFFKTDCTINEDDLTVSVQPQVEDRYEAVLNGMEKEYNLVELAPAIERISAGKRPMLQIYADGDSVVSCLYEGNYFETDKTGDGNPEDFGFKKFGERTEFNFTNSSDAGFTTPFTGALNIWESGSIFTNADGIYYIEYWVDNPGSAWYDSGLRIRRVSDDVEMWYIRWDENPWEPKEIPTTITFTPTGEYGSVTANRSHIDTFGRYVLDKSSVDGQDCAPIEPNDIVSNNRNYHYVIGYHNLTLAYSARYSDEPTEWGRNDLGKYFMTPNDEDEWYPIGQSQWVNASLWVRYTAAERAFEQGATKQFQLKDTYPLYSVISVLLAKIAPSITHEGTAAYSHFFYDDTQIGNPADRLRNSRPFITQKSNVLVGEYQEPAQKAPVTLKDITEMLKKVYGCYWYIDANNKFCIEHIAWFKNGGSYGSSPVVGYNLKQLINLPNGKPWAFHTSEYQFDKEDMPARYQYEWMDKSTDLFNGKPINVLSRFVKEDKVEEITIGNFTSDVDYMLLVAENCSKDGFALFQAVKVNNVWTLPYETFMREQYVYRLQNYMVSMIQLQDWFLTYDMPSWSIEVEDAATTADGIQRNKKQTLSFPIGENDPDMEKLVKTNMGDGQFDKLAINLSSRTAKVTLKYNTYDQ